MKKFQPVNKGSREEMVDFLTNHFRHNTLRPWNSPTSYANNLAISNLPTSIYDKIASLIDNWEEQYAYRWQAWFNGDCLVLYQGEKSLFGKITYLGRSTDQNKDFSNWDIFSIKRRVELIESFDKLCDDIVALTKSNVSVGSQVLVPRTGGGYSPGEIVYIKDDVAVVEFLLGDTYKGGKSPDPNIVGTKKVKISELAFG